jgi:hydroxymethylpyrimidine/phosphomethylpyrimidine kinase
LLRRATVVTPNLPEADELLGDPAAWAASEGVAVLLTGGHASGPEVVDRLLLPAGGSRAWTHPRRPGPNPHGTGCALSAALAARLALGDELVAAAEAAIAWTASQVARAESLGRGRAVLVGG